jgi:hypothetical protein
MFINKAYFCCEKQTKANKNTMPEFIEIIDRLLLKKTGKRASELDYMEFPEEDEGYNTKLAIGNIHLSAGRIKTKKQADKLVNDFLNTKIP